MWHGLCTLDTARTQCALRQAARDHFVAQQDAIPSDINVLLPAFADPELIALLQQAAPGTDMPEFYVQYQDEIQQLLVRHGLDFADPKHLSVMHRNQQLVRNALIVLKKNRLSVFRDQ
jgi:hypothetical protein